VYHHTREPLAASPVRASSMSIEEDGVPEMVVHWIVPSVNWMPTVSPLVMVTVVPGKVVVSSLSVTVRVKSPAVSEAAKVVLP
jgi:hypothetical protein